MDTTCQPLASEVSRSTVLQSIASVSLLTKVTFIHPMLSKLHWKPTSTNSTPTNDFRFCVLPFAPPLTRLTFRQSACGSVRCVRCTIFVYSFWVFMHTFKKKRGGGGILYSAVCSPLSVRETAQQKWPLLLILLCWAVNCEPGAQRYFSSFFHSTFPFLPVAQGRIYVKPHSAKSRIVTVIGPERG